MKTPYFSLKKSDLSIHKLEAMRPFYKWVPRPTRLFSSYSPGDKALIGQLQADLGKLLDCSSTTESVRQSEWAVPLFKD